MKAFILSVLIFFSALGTSSATPKWYPPEPHRPYWHFGLSAGAQLTSYWFFYKVVKVKHERALLYSIPFGFLPGFVKEKYDGITGIFDMEDIAYNMMGVSTGVCIVLVYRLHFMD